MRREIVSLQGEPKKAAVLEIASDEPFTETVEDMSAATSAALDALQETLKFIAASPGLQQLINVAPTLILGGDAASSETQRATDLDPASDDLGARAEALQLKLNDLKHGPLRQAKMADFATKKLVADLHEILGLVAQLLPQAAALCRLSLGSCSMYASRVDSYKARIEEVVRAAASLDVKDESLRELVTRLDLDSMALQAASSEYTAEIKSLEHINAEQQVKIDHLQALLEAATAPKPAPPPPAPKPFLARARAALGILTNTILTIE